MQWCVVVCFEVSFSPRHTCHDMRFDAQHIVVFCCARCVTCRGLLCDS
jgi:hypothetical protein